MAIAIFAALLYVATHSSKTSGLYNETVKLTRTEVWKNINSGKASSISVAIMDNGKIVYSEGFGMADREKSIPVDKKTLFNMGSISKVFCAAAIMNLVDEGKVELDAPITKYLPEFKMADPRYKDITVRMLLNHSSDVPGTTYANNMGYGFNDTVYEEIMANLAHSNLKAAPGETAPYTNDGFSLAEILVSRVSGQKYIDFLSERIFKPLSLKKTGLGVGERTNEGISLYYKPDTAQQVPPEVISILGAGGLSSTPEDLVVFMDSFSDKGKKVLSNESIAEIIKAQPSLFAKTTLKETGINPEGEVGLGFDFVEMPSYKEKGIKVIGKAGATYEYSAFAVSVPSERISVAVMAAGTCDVQGIAIEILNSILDAKGILKKEETPVMAPPSPQPIPTEYANFAGYYAGESSITKISFDFNQNTAAMTTMAGDQEISSINLTYRDGYFYPEIGPKFAFLSSGGKKYIVVSIHELNSVFGEKITVTDEPKSLKMDMNGTKWLRRNVKPFEAMYQTTSHVITALYNSKLPGYVDFNGPKKIDSPDFAGMAFDIVRDQKELTLLDVNGETWAQLSEMIYSPINTAMPLEIGNNEKITIEKNGYSEWLQADTDMVLEVKKPDRARVIIFAPDSSIYYDSVIDKGDVFVKAGSLIELAGMPGDVMEVTAKSPSS